MMKSIYSLISLEHLIFPAANHFPNISQRGALRVDVEVPINR